MRPTHPMRRHDAVGAWAPRRRPGLLAGVLLAHVLLLLGWHLELSPRLRGTPPTARQSALVWLQLTPPPRPAPGVAPPPGTEAAKPPPAKARARHTAQPAVPPAARPEPASLAEAAPMAIHLPAPEPAASAASAPRERLMDTAATRAAIRQTGRSTLLSERAASATDQPFVSRGEKEAQAVARTAKGDCLKGEFAGAGMGLLSVPFFVVAEARGQCAR